MVKILKISIILFITFITFFVGSFSFAEKTHIVSYIGTCIWDFTIDKKVFVKDGIKHRVDSHYALDSLGICRRAEADRSKMEQIPESDPIVLDSKICYLAENSENCKAKIEKYKEIFKLSPYIEDENLIIFKDSLIDCYEEHCRVARAIEKRDVEDCKKSPDEFRCIDDLMDEACGVFDVFSKQPGYNFPLEGCKNFFLNELGGVEYCKSRGSESAACLTDFALIALKEGDIETEKACELMELPQKDERGVPKSHDFKADCYYKLAKERGDPSFCEKAGVFSIGKCYSEMASLLNNVDLCDKAIGFRSECHSEFPFFSFTKYNIKKIIYSIILLLVAISLLVISLRKLYPSNVLEIKTKTYFYISMIPGSIFLGANGAFIFLVSSDFHQLFTSFLSPNFPFVTFNVFILLPGALEFIIGNKFIYNYDSFLLITFVVAIDFLFILFIGYLFDILNRITKIYNPVIMYIGMFLLLLFMAFMVISSFILLAQPAT